MGITANSGPFLGYGITQTTSGLVSEYNEERAPSLFDMGAGMLDPRPAFNYSPGSGVGTKVYGFHESVALVDYVPTAVSSNAIAAAQQPSAGAALTLNSTGAGITVTTITAPEDGTTTGNLSCIDSTAAALMFTSPSSWATAVIWNPAAGAGRTISITTSSSGDGGTWSVLGRDIYGYKLTENITTTGASATVSGVKAFKYVTSVVACTTITSTGVIVGFTDTFGLPLKTAYSGLNTQIRLIATSSLVGQNSSGPLTVASTAATQTSTTPDVRGTYASTTATNGTLRVQIMQRIMPNSIASVTASDQTAIFGATQYSST